MNAAIYVRVSTEEQATGLAISPDQQRKICHGICERNGWDIVGEFSDVTNYVSTKPPGPIGKVVNPSAKRIDRPGFVALLDLVESGSVDVVVCWRDDRLYRHERVVTALKNAFELAAERRNGRPVEVYQETGVITQDFMYLQAMMWRKENEARVARTRMGKIGTLEQGRWPGVYKRLGYRTVKEKGKRGRKIVLADAEEVQTVRGIYEWCASGLSLREIRAKLLASGADQKKGAIKHDWSIGVIQSVLRAPDYMGKATWSFHDKEHSIEIPRIIDDDLWQRCQRQLERNKTLATRNGKVPYMLQGIVECGDCGHVMGCYCRRYDYYTLADGTRKRNLKKMPEYYYVCPTPRDYPDEDHARPYSRYGALLDDQVWRTIVDDVIRRPDVVKAQTLRRQAELIAQGDAIDGDIERTRGEVADIEQQRAFYQRQAARGKMTEAEFDARMDETQGWLEEKQAEIAHLLQLRDDASRVNHSLQYATEFLTGLQRRVTAIDQSREEMRQMSRQRREKIMRTRREIVRALVDKVIWYPDGSVEIQGVIDGSEAVQSESIGRPTWSRSVCLPRTSASEGRGTLPTTR